MDFKRLVIMGGKTGFVGKALTKHLAPHFPSVDVYGRGDSPAFYAGDLVINAAGRKDVLRCESDVTNTYQVNAIFAGNIAGQCKRAGAQCVQISSDHAYATPRTVYGDSKRLGEELVRRECPDALIAVTGHVYDVDCPWVKWLHGELMEGRKVQTWALDNWPTYAGHLAEMILQAIEGYGWGSSFLMHGQWKADRARIFVDYAECFGFNQKLIQWPPTEAPSYYPRKFNFSGLVTGFDGVPTYEGFRRMKKEMKRGR